MKKEEKKEGTTLVISELIQAETFKSTMGLRYVKKRVDISMVDHNYELRLQQLWIGSKGNLKWEWVPEVFFKEETKEETKDEIKEETKDTVQDVLRILKNGAEKPIDDLNDYMKGKSVGERESYAHALDLVKKLLD